MVKIRRRQESILSPMARRAAPVDQNIATGLQQLGSGLMQFGAAQDRSEKKREAARMQLADSQALMEFQAQSLKVLNTAVQNAPEDGNGIDDAVTEQGQQLIESIVSGMEPDRADRIAARMTDHLTGLRRKAINAEASLAGEAAKNAFISSVDMIQKGIRESIALTPGLSLDSAITDATMMAEEYVNSIAEARGLSDREKKGLLDTAIQTSTLTYFDSLIENGHYDTALEKLEDPNVSAGLSADATKQIRRKAESELDKVMLARQREFGADLDSTITAARSGLPADFSPYSDDSIKAVFPEDWPEIIQQKNDAIKYQEVHSAATKQPLADTAADIVSMAEEVEKAAGEDPARALQIQRDMNTVRSVYMDNLKKLENDPVDYIAVNSPGVLNSKMAMDELIATSMNGQPIDKARLKEVGDQYISDIDGSYDYYTKRGKSPSLLSDGQAESIAAFLSDVKVNPDTKVMFMNNVQAALGKDTSRLFTGIVGREELSKNAMIAASLGISKGSRLAWLAISNEENNAKLIKDKGLTADVREAVADSDEIQDLVKTFQKNIGSTIAADIQNMQTIMTRQLVAMGEDPEEAAEKAANAFAERYEYQNLVRIPKEAVQGSKTITSRRAAAGPLGRERESTETRQKMELIKDTLKRFESNRDLLIVYAVANGSLPRHRVQTYRDAVSGTTRLGIVDIGPMPEVEAITNWDESGVIFTWKGSDRAPVMSEGTTATPIGFTWEELLELESGFIGGDWNQWINREFSEENRKEAEKKFLEERGAN